jgi:16S rRNA (guanine527-N7)-methyltransferase
VARPATDSLDDFFKAFPALLSRPATPAERNAFGRYANLLVLWNRTHHLTALKTRSDIARVLFLDSLVFKAVLPRGPLRILDVGAGAGIPGVPLRVTDPTIALTLIESRRKPVSFLHALIRELALLDVSLHHGRAEALLAQLPELQGKYDAVVTRAVGLGSDVIEMAMAYLKPGGTLIAAGPPIARTMPRIDWPGSAEWKMVEFSKIGVKRAFLVATNQD